MQSVKSIPIVKAVEWPLLASAALILLSSSGLALNSGPCGEDGCSITVTSIDPLTEVVDITRPVVKHPFFSYGTIQPGDKITMIDAGGCVQRGGEGLTWYRYVNPIGPGSDHLYFGSMELPGVLAKTRFSDLIGKTIEVPPSKPTTLVLYYEDIDSGYNDNGYYKHDPGPGNQCAGADAGPAHVTLTIVHATIPVSQRVERPLPPPHPALPWDLVELIQPDNPLRHDDNQFLLNPRWFWQTPGASQPPIVPFPSSQMPTTDENLPVRVATGGAACDGQHINWFPVTYTGKLHWDGHSCSDIFDDDDYNIDIFGPTILLTSFVAGGTSDNPHGIHGEFAAFETVNLFRRIDQLKRSKWWENFHVAVDKDRTTKHKGVLFDLLGLNCTGSASGEGSHGGALIEGHDAVMTGLMGLDTVHGAKAELHPVYALAIREAKMPNPADDAWAVFVRNWGNEGYCGTNQHYAERGSVFEANSPVKSISIRFPRPLGIPRAAIATLSKDTLIFPEKVPSVGGQGLFKLNTIPEGDAVITFQLNTPTQKSFQFGEVHLVWAVPGPIVQTQTIAAAATPPAVAAATPPATDEEERAGEESAPVVALFNSLSPADQEAILSRLDDAFPPEETSPSQPSTWTEVIGPPEPVNGDPIVYDGPDEGVAEMRAIGWGALCAVTAGVTPLIPHFCTALNVAHIEAETFAAQSGGISTFGSETGFGSGITNIDGGDWVQYPQVNFGDGTLDTFVALMASRHSGNHVEVHLDALDGERIASIATEGTGKDEGDLGTFTEQSASMASVSGVHDVFIVFKGKTRHGEGHHVRRGHDIGNFDWFGLRHTGINEASRKHDGE